MPPPPVYAAPDQAALATRAGGLLALASCAVGLLLAVWITPWSPAQTAVLLVLLGLVSAVGVLALRAPDRMSPALALSAVVVGTASVSVGMVVVGAQAVAAADNEMLFLVPVLYSAYFFRAWAVALVTGTASVSYGGALLALELPMPLAQWLTTTSALVLVAVLVHATRTRDIGLLAASADQALRDPLTGLLNRRGLVLGSQDWPADELCVLLVDLDHFKAVNDEHGHLVGDRVLVHVADALMTGLRPADVVARFGGEEFVLLLPGCTAAEGSRRAQQLLEQVERDSAGWPVPVRLSVGVAAGRRPEAELTDLLARADRALYAAKGAGRNTVRVDVPAQRPVVKALP